mmetsp:Transcript_12286/g.33739  ORF Transcript_12286/g.33739 Transcript_12286/m.33739 type:complete len:402 (+) Transcript_12286:53-1258(+)
MRLSRAIQDATQCQDSQPTRHAVTSATSTLRSGHGIETIQQTADVIPVGVPLLSHPLVPFCVGGRSCSQSPRTSCRTSGLQQQTTPDHVDSLTENGECTCLWQQHREPQKTFQQRGVPLWLQKLQTQSREHWRLQQVHQLVQLLQEVQRQLQRGKAGDQLCGQLILLSPQAQCQRAHGVVEPRFQELQKKQGLTELCGACCREFGEGRCLRQLFSNTSRLPRRQQDPAEDLHKLLRELRVGDIVLDRSCDSDVESSSSQLATELPYHKLASVLQHCPVRSKEPQNLPRDVEEEISCRLVVALFLEEHISVNVVGMHNLSAHLECRHDHLVVSVLKCLKNSLERRGQHALAQHLCWTTAHQHGDPLQTSDPHDGAVLILLFHQLHQLVHERLDFHITPELLD